MDVETQARELLSLHGRRASQLVVDDMVAAIRRGDDPEALRCQAILSALEAALLCSPRLEGHESYGYARTQSRDR